MVSGDEQSSDFSFVQSFKSIIYFANVSSKDIIAKDYSIDYRESLCNFHYVRYLPPKLFIQYLTNKTGKHYATEDTFISLFERIPKLLMKEARLRCVQIILEYACYSHKKNLKLFNDFLSHNIFTNHKEDVNDVFNKYFSNIEDKTINWLEESIKNDNKLFASVVNLITSNSIDQRLVLACKNSLQWSHKMNTKKRIYVDSSFVSLEDAIFFRRAYELSLFGRFFLDDLNSKESLWGVLCAEKKYMHSKFVPLCKRRPDQETLFCIKTKTKTTEFVLVLHDGKFKNTFLNNYLAAIELLSNRSNEFVYCDKRLNHNFVNNDATRDYLYFDSSPFLFLPEHKSADESRLKIEYLNYLLERGETVSQSLTENYSLSCSREEEDSIITREVDFEKNRINFIRHVEDFLLWLAGLKKKL